MTRTPAGKKALAGTGMDLLALSVAVVILNVPRSLAQDATDWQAKAGGRMSFDVASVKQSKIPRPPNFGLGTGDAKANNVSHGFVRAPDGTWTTFDAPGAGTGSAQGTISRSINSAGAITGSYQDASYVNHSFVRAPDGTITTFDAPTGTGSGQIVAFAINDNGSTTGNYWYPSTGVPMPVHAFVRAPDGTLTTFDAPGAAQTISLSINTAGAITGDYQDSSNLIYGFLRTPDGTVSTFDAGAGVTTGLSINPAGTITGVYDVGPVTHGFLRATDGTINILDVPGAAGTSCRSINAAGDITGSYGGPISHGFLLTSRRHE